MCEQAEMALQSALNKLRTGEKLDNTPARQEVVSVPSNTSVALSLFTVDGNDSFNFDEDDNDIFKADDSISYSPPLSMSCTGMEEVHSSAGATSVSPCSSFHGNDTPLLSELSTSRGVGNGDRVTHCVMDCISQDGVGFGCTEHGKTEHHGLGMDTESNTPHLANKNPPDKKACSTSEEAVKLQSLAVQKLNLFKFVKTDRKRSRERNEASVCGSPPWKIPMARDEDSCISQRRPAAAVGGTWGDEAEPCGGWTKGTTDGGMPCRSNTSSGVQNASLLPSTRDSDWAGVSTPSTSVMVVNDASLARGNRTPSSGFLTPLTPRSHTPLHANRTSSDTAQVKPHGFPEVLFPSQADFTVTTPLRSTALTTHTFGMTATNASTPSSTSAAGSTFLSQQQSIITPASLFPSHLTNLPPNTSWCSSSRTHASSSTYSTPKGRRLPSSTPAALICTPEPGCRGVGIIGTPVPLPRRRFPGPAGLLPPLIPGQNMEQIYIAPPSTPRPTSTPRLAHRPTTRVLRNRGGGGVISEGGEFSRGPWVEMLEDLDLNDSHSSALLDYSIVQAVKQFINRLLSNGKVVHLRVILKIITFSGMNASGVLKDPTGEIMCTIHWQVVEEHRRELQVGAVLILRQVSMFSPSPRKHYLNITPPNIVRVYPPEGTSSAITTPLLLSEIERNLLDNKAATLPRPRPLAAGSLTPSPITRSLFGTSHCDHLILESRGRTTDDTPRRCTIRPFVTGGKGSLQHSMQANPNFVSKAVENHERNEVDKDIEMTFFTNICEDEFNDLFRDMAD